MSYNIRNIREISTEPLTSFVNKLAKRIAKFQNDKNSEKLENKEDIYSNAEDVESIIRFHNFVGNKSYDFLTQYVTPFEPDGDKVRLMIKGENMGNNLRDQSTFDHTVGLKGDPILIDGTPFDYGLNTGDTKSVCLKFNRPTSVEENREYIEIEDSEDLRVNGITTGISYFIRFRIHNLSSQGSFTRTLLAKYDDVNNGVLIQVTSDGRLTFYIKRAGTEYRVQTATSTIATDTVYELWCTYTVSGNVQHVYVNNVDKSLTTPSSPSWPTTTANMQIFRREAHNGYVYGDFYDSTTYREKVVSATEVGRHYTNKISIVDIEFGKVGVSNYTATYIIASSSSFTSTSFTSTSFTT